MFGRGKKLCKLWAYQINMWRKGKLFVFSGFVVFFSSFGMAQDEIEFVCVKTRKSTNMCYYNFKVNGIPHHFRDVGCKRKKDQVVKAVGEGTLALSKDWEIPCPEEKKD